MTHTVSAPKAIVPPKADAQTLAENAKRSHVIEIDDLSLYYGAARALKNVKLSIREKLVTAFIGPSGCGKSTLIRCINRMNDLIENVRVDGQVRIDGHDVFGHAVDVIELRKRVGMVFQKS